MMDFFCFVVLVALAVKFLRTLAIKWGILEWLQVHSPSKFFDTLFSCEFCQSFHLGMAICIVCAIITHNWYLLLVPIFSSNIL